MNLTIESSFESTQLKTIEAKCCYFENCGGCSLQHLETEDQLKLKHQWAKTLLMTHDLNPSIELSPINADEWNYRHRARLSVKFLKNKEKMLVGFREKKKPFVMDMDSCCILPQDVSDLIPQLKLILIQLSIPNKIPQIEIAKSDNLISLVFRHLEPLNEIDIHLLNQFEKKHKLKIYLQPKGIDTIQLLNQSTNHLSYTLKTYPFKFDYHPNHFTQINPSANESLIRLSLDLLQVNSSDQIGDFFCGIGNFSLALAYHAAHVTGYEILESQINQAQINAKKNNLDSKTLFKVQDLETFSTDFDMEIKKFNKILLDPPRSGAFALIDQIPINNIQSIVYISCNPETFARDAELLVKKGYTFQKWGIINMFPHTAHIESIGLFISTG